MRVSLDDWEFSAYLVVLPIYGFDVILGMNWLSVYKVKINFLPRQLLVSCQGIR